MAHQRSAARHGHGLACKQRQKQLKLGTDWLDQHTNTPTHYTLRSKHSIFPVALYHDILDRYKIASYLDCDTFCEQTPNTRIYTEGDLRYLMPPPGLRREVRVGPGGQPKQLPLRRELPLNLRRPWVDIAVVVYPRAWTFDGLYFILEATCLPISGYFNYVLLYA